MFSGAVFIIIKTYCIQDKQIQNLFRTSVELPLIIIRIPRQVDNNRESVRLLSGLVTVIQSEVDNEWHWGHSASMIFEDSMSHDKTTTTLCKQLREISLRETRFNPRIQLQE